MENNVSGSKIKWVEQSDFFGLDYSTKKGTYKDFTFDIRYDSDGSRTTKPNCGCCLIIYFKNAKIDSVFGGIGRLTNYSNSYLERELLKYQN